MATTNYSIYAIPAYWFLALIPHAFGVQRIKKANNGRWNNANPKSTAYHATMEKSVPAEVFATYERSEAAHKNAMENLPLFATAVILGNMAKLPANTLNTVVGAYLGLRVAYTFAYINTTSQRLSFVRTGIWAASVSSLIYLLVRSGNVLAHGYV